MLRFDGFWAAFEPRRGMGLGFAVKRLGGNDCVHHKYQLSFLSPEDFSVSESMDLPFDKHDYVYGGRCGGLLYFHGIRGKIVICNPITKELRALDPPKLFYGNRPQLNTLMTSCLGYDAKSEDFKVIRFYHQLVVSELDDGDRSSKKYMELYSFKRGSWEKIKRPPFNTNNCSGVYVKETGSCYWAVSSSVSCEGLLAYARSSCLVSPDDKYEDLVAYLGTIFGGSPADRFSHVLLFDFATESFGHLPLPKLATTIPHSEVELFECCGSLGALVYWRPHPRGEPCYYDYDSDTDPDLEDLSFQLSVWNGMSWDEKYVVSLPDVKIPLGLRDDHLLFLESKSRVDVEKPLFPNIDLYYRRSHLMVYDLDTKHMKDLDMYDHPTFMTVISYGA